jgi:hypothetical protein
MDLVGPFFCPSLVFVGGAAAAASDELGRFVEFFCFLLSLFGGADVEGDGVR